MQTVVVNHEGSVEAAVLYIVAVLGESSDVPVSDDIGGLPQVITDNELESDRSSSSASVSIEIEVESSENENLCRQEELDEGLETLPSYKDVAEGSFPPPYDSLYMTSAHSLSPTAANTRPPGGTVFSLAQKMRTRQRKKKGYHSHKT